MSNDGVWQFPCVVALKVVADRRPDLDSDVMCTLQKIKPGDYSLRETLSSGGKYVSLTVSVPFANKDEVMAVYAALRAVAGIKMVL